MNATELKALQAPLKQQYKDTPETAIITLKANGRIGEGVTQIGVKSVFQCTTFVY